MAVNVRKVQASRGPGLAWLRFAVRAAAWRPSNASLLLRHWMALPHERERAADETAYLQAIAGWLARAQDAASGGAVSDAYHLGRGWEAPLPGATAAAASAFATLHRRLGAQDLRERGVRALGSLLRLQREDGSFDDGGGATSGSPHTTSEILSTWIDGRVASLDPEERLPEALARGARWLATQASSNGEFVEPTRLHERLATGSHAAAVLAEAAQRFDANDLREVAKRALERALAEQDPETGWLVLPDPEAPDGRAERANTHAIAFNLTGWLQAARALRHAENLSALRDVSWRLLRRLEISRGLPATLDRRWRRADAALCPSGNVLMASIWLGWFEAEGDARWLNGALKALAEARSSVQISSLPRVRRGGLPGAVPIWGPYRPFHLTTRGTAWLADALVARQEALDSLGSRPRGRWQIPDDVPTSLPSQPGAPVARRPRVILLTNPQGSKVAQLSDACSGWGFVPDAVVIERGPTPSRILRGIAALRRHGPSRVLRIALARTRPRGRAEGTEAGRSWPDPHAFCERTGVPRIEVERLTTPDATEALRALEPDVLVSVGSGILRRGTLEIPTLGTLNAHMGVLPRYRGVNVAEWAYFQGDPVGCTVHLVDTGIDTGDIVCTRLVDTSGVRSIRDLRRRLDDAQMSLLAEVLRFICSSGELPPRRHQRAEEGMQFFRMAPELARRLEWELADPGRSHPDRILG